MKKIKILSLLAGILCFSTFNGFIASGMNYQQIETPEGGPAPLLDGYQEENALKEDDLKKKYIENFKKTEKNIEEKMQFVSDGIREITKKKDNLKIKENDLKEKQERIKKNIEEKEKSIKNKKQ